MQAHLDLQSQWRRLLATPGGRAVLAALSSSEIADIAERLAATDANDENALTRAALTIVEPESTTGVALAYRHQLACLARESRWRSGLLDRARFRREMDIEGPEWLVETRGAATILVLPMQLYTSDGVAIAAEAFESRKLVFFGENLALEDLRHVGADVEFAAQGLSGVRAVERVLAAGGIFCTFADFVYAGRKPMLGQLFGTSRPFASGFVQIAARPGAVLLPLACGLFDGRPRLTFFEPTQMPAASAVQLRTPTALALLLRQIETMLERSIARAPAQWLLLNTLVAGAEQMADATTSLRDTIPAAGAEEVSA